MAREASFRTALVADLHRQLQYAPRETVRRQMGAAEALAAIVEPDRGYPADFVVFRVTGYRPSDGAPAETIPGVDLRGDLVALVLRFSHAIGLREDEAPAVGRRAVPLEALAADLGVSVRTLQRWRARGLVTHHLVTGEAGDETAQVVVFADAFERFRAAEPGLVARAASFRRASPAEQAAVLDRARALRAAEPTLTLAAASRRIAAESGLGRESIRQHLLAHERRAASGRGEALFHPPRPLDERALRTVRRADAAGVPVATLAARLGRSPASIRRAIRRARADRLLAVAPPSIELPTFARASAGEVILAPAVVREHLLDVPAVDDVLAGVDPRPGATADGPRVDPPGTDELVAAMHFLRRRATTALAGLARWPGETVLDAIERDLRWAVLLRRRLVLRSLPSALVALRRVLAADPSTLPRAAIGRVLELAVDVAGAAVEGHDPLPGGAARSASLHARTVGLMDRRLAALPGVGELAPSGRAAARVDLATIDLVRAVHERDELARIVLPRRITEALRRGLDLEAGAATGTTDDERRTLVERFWALDGGPPATIAELAEADDDRTAASVARLVRAETRRLVRIAGA